MSRGPHSLAIEISSRAGSIALGRGDQLLATRSLPPQQRHRLDLMPTIDALGREHGLQPADLGEIHVSVGPGSFTGLRIAVTTAKVLALVTNARIVAVATLDVLAAGVPDPATLPGSRAADLAVCLNMKKDAVYSGRYCRDGGRWVAAGEPALRTLAQLLADSPRPLLVLGDPLPPLPPDAGDVRLLPADLAVPRAEHVWRLGRALAALGRFTPADRLLPLYVRAPEAEELWRQRAAGAG